MVPLVSVQLCISIFAAAHPFQLGRQHNPERRSNEGVRVCVCACMCVRVRACVCVCVHAFMRYCNDAHTILSIDISVPDKNISAKQTLL